MWSDWKMIMDAIKFGTDGWRGVMAEDFTFPNVRRVTAGTIAYLKKNRPDKPGPLLIGYDRRFGSREFAQCVASHLQRAGFSVKLSNTPMTTPSLSVSLVAQKSSWGFMITASHNPAIYNGFKIKEGSGRSAPPDVTAQIEQAIPAQDTDGATLPMENDLPSFDFHKEYETYLRKRLDMKALLSFKARVALDHLHGVAAGIPESFLSKSKLSFISLHAAADPLFGGLHPEPIDANLAELQQAVRKNKALVGFAFDGDADRLGAVDDLGRYMTPHQVFPLLTLYCIEQKGWRGKVVQSVSLGALGERIAKAHNLDFEEVPVGFKHVAQRMISEDIVAGGEESGGYAFKGGLPERDGILSALFFLEMLAVTGKKPSQLLNSMEKRFGAARFHRKDITLRQPIWDKTQFSNEIKTRLPDKIAGSAVAEVRTGDGVKIVLQDGAWVLMRPSGTEPLLRTYAETDKWERTHKLLALAENWVEGYA
jgi:phosphomannomutase